MREAFTQEASCWEAAVPPSSGTQSLYGINWAHKVPQDLSQRWVPGWKGRLAHPRLPNRPTNTDAPKNTVRVTFLSLCSFL